RLLYGVPNRSPYPKDGIGDHVVRGRPSVNPVGVGTKAALHYLVTVAAGETATIRLRLSGKSLAPPLKADWTRVLTTREREANEFHAALLPPGTSPQAATVARQAIAGMVWGKQFFHYDVDRWLRGDPGQPTPPATRLTGRNCSWRHLNK